MTVVEERSFIMKHTFADLEKMNVDSSIISEEKKHFGVFWTLSVNQGGGYYCFYLNCKKPRGSGNWSVKANVEYKLFKKTEEPREIERNACFNSNCSSIDFCYDDASELNGYLVDGCLTIEAKVKINKMEEVEGSLRCFDDETTKKFSDVVLIAGDKKFYLNKMYLAAHSPCFESLLMGNFKESGQAEIELKDIDPWDFQNFLEVIYGELAVTEETVNGILKLADFYDSKTAIRRCESYLVNNSSQSLKDKFDLAINYKLADLKAKCFDEMKTTSDIRRLIPDDPTKLECSLWRELLLKSLSISR